MLRFKRSGFGEDFADLGFKSERQRGGDIRASQVFCCSDCSAQLYVIGFSLQVKHNSQLCLTL
jgi:hypothetical protein